MKILSFIDGDLDKKVPNFGSHLEEPNSGFGSHSPWRRSALYECSCYYYHLQRHDDDLTFVHIQRAMSTLNVKIHK